MKSDTTAASVAEMWKEVRRMEDELVKDDELAGAKESLKLGLPGQFESVESLTDALAGLVIDKRPLDEYATLPARIDKVTAEDVQKAARAHLHPRRHDRPRRGRSRSARGDARAAPSSAAPCCATRTGTQRAWVRAHHDDAGRPHFFEAPRRARASRQRGWPSWRSRSSSSFLGKDEVIRLLLIATIAGEHAVLIGPPGTAKSALVRTFARLLDAKYFEYLLTRFTEPNEIFGPVDLAAFRDGRYERRTEGMLPEAEIVFLDEVFKSNSAILNALLTLLNERRYTSGGKVMKSPLLSAPSARPTKSRPTRTLGGHLRPLPPPHPLGQPRRVPLPGSPRAGPRERDRSG